MSALGTAIGMVLKQLFSKGVNKIWENKSTLSLYFKTNFGKYRNKRVRFSFSYLIRIKIPNTHSYLLVFNRRINNQLQPVGGAYQRYDDNRLFESWDYLPDNNKNGIGVDTKSSEDLRGTIKGKHVISLIKWFEEGKGREITFEREFKEELFTTGILEEGSFKTLRFQHIKRVSKNLKWSVYHNCFEVLIYDIVDFLPTAEEISPLLSIYNEVSPNKIKGEIAVVECDEIEQLRVMQNNKQVAKIGEHTKLIINQNF